MQGKQGDLSKAIQKIPSRQIVYEDFQPIDPDFIRDCLMRRESFKNKKRVGSELSLNGSCAEGHLDDFSDEDFFTMTHSSSVHLSKLEEAKQLITEAKINEENKNYEIALKQYIACSLCLNECSGMTDFVPLFTECKLDLASLYLNNGKPEEAERELVDLMSVNKDCAQAKELMSKIVSH